MATEAHPANVSTHVSYSIRLHAEPVDARKSFDGLFGIVKNDLGIDLRSGGLFMFLNRRCNRIKLMYWDSDGIAIWMKRLERGCFQRPLRSPDGKHVIIEPSELQANLEAAKKEAEAEIERITYERKKPTKERKKAADGFPAHLPREIVEVQIPDTYQQRIDSGELVIKRYELIEAIKTIPSKLVVIQYKKPVLAYANDLDRELPVEEEANLGEKGRYHPSTAAQVVHGKFGQHLPLYRLQDLFSGSGWTPSRSSLDYITDLVDEVTQDLPRMMLSRMLVSQCIGLDDTHIKLIMPKEIPKLVPGSQDLRTKRLIEKMREAIKEKKDSLDAKMWGYTSFDATAPYDLFDFRVSRHRDGPDEFLSGYAGHVMADCYSGNMSVILAPGSKMTRMACWAHARRHVYEHQDNDKTVSAYPLALMNQLYDIERRAKVEELLPDVWKAHHAESVRSYRAEERRYKANNAKLQSAKRKCRKQLSDNPSP